MDTKWTPKTVGQLVEELRCYPAEATVTSFKAVVDTGRLKSTTTYSARHAKKLYEMRQADHALTGYGR